MNNEKFKEYAVETIKLLKKQALKAKKDADNPKGGFKDYVQGTIMGYYSIINLLKHQAFVFCIDQKELRLADIKPDIDLLGLHENPDVLSIEDGWSIDRMTEEKVRMYLSDTIKLLIEQAMAAKKNTIHPEKGSEDYSRGELMAYYRVIHLMENRASLFNLDQKELGLSSIEFSHQSIVFCSQR